MAFIVGYATDEEIEKLKARGWKIEPAKKYGLVGDWPNSLVADPPDGHQAIAVFVDNSLFAIMSGPDWEQD